MTAFENFDYNTSMSHEIYRPELATVPFMLGRHGESVLNAGTMIPGRGDEIDGLPPNCLTEIGVSQIEAMHPAFAAAGIAVRYVSSSELRRAQESALVFANTSPGQSPVLKDTVADLKEASKLGWETLYTRSQEKALRKATLAMEIERLQIAQLPTDLEGYVPWITLFGDGESPLEAGLRGISAVGHCGVEPHELIFSHGMLNRFSDAIATRVPEYDRATLLELLEDRSPHGTLATLRVLSDLAIPRFDTADSKPNRTANGGITEYTINHNTGLWVAGRRIELPKESDTHLFIEHKRMSDGMWARITPGDDTTTASNE